MNSDFVVDHRGVHRWTWLRRACFANIDRDTLDLAWLALGVCFHPGRLEFRSGTAKPRPDISLLGRAYFLEVVAVLCLLLIGDFGFGDVAFNVETVPEAETT